MYVEERLFIQQIYNFETQRTAMTLFRLSFNETCILLNIEFHEALVQVSNTIISEIESMELCEWLVVTVRLRIYFVRHIAAFDIDTYIDIRCNK